MAMMLKSSEQALIRKAKQGDGRAIEGLIRAHQDALYAFMLRMSGLENPRMECSPLEKGVPKN